PQDARKYLSEVVDIIAMIGQRLRKRGALYAPLFEAIASLAEQDASGQTSVLEESEDDNRDDTPAALDAAWEESPVTFDDAAVNAGQGHMDRANESRHAWKHA